MEIYQLLLITIVEGLTEFFPISSTAHMLFLSSFFNIQNNDFVKMYMISIQFGTILSVIVLYSNTLLKVNQYKFFIKLILSTIPVLICGWIFKRIIINILEYPIIVSLILIAGGLILLIIDKLFNQTKIKTIMSLEKMIKIGVWQCLGIIPGVSRSAASIVGGMQQGLNKKDAIEYSFFLSIPTMFFVFIYSIFLKNWYFKGKEQKGFEMILESKKNIIIFFGGNFLAFFIGLISINFFLKILKKFGFKFWGIYRIILGIFILLYFS